MNYVYIIIAAYNILYVNATTSETIKFLSTIEAFVKGGTQLCLGDCTGWAGNEQCVYNWEGDVSKCSVLIGPDNKTPKYTRKYITIENEPCYSNCDKYNETYDWCVVQGNNNIYDWRVCSRRVALKGVQTYRTQNEFLTCTDACAPRKETYNWCHTIKDWQRCDPLKKVIVFNVLAENEKECATPCELYNNKPYCYDKDGEWKKCFFNPDSTEELSRLSEHTKATRAPGVFTPQGYKRCKRTYRRDAFSRPLTVEDIAKQYEENFPTIEVKSSKIVSTDNKTEPALDERLAADRMVAEDKNPVLSFTVYNIDSLFGGNRVNIPLVIRAVINNKTLQIDSNSDVTNQFQELYPIDDRLHYDEMGYFVPLKLGGPTETYNIFPQFWRHSRGSLSGWWYLESELYTFINTHPNSYAEYTVVVTYKPDDLRRPYRPTSVGVTVRLYHGTLKDNDGFNQLCDLNGIPTTPSMNSLENMYFINDPDFNCIIDNNPVDGNSA